MRSRAGAPEQLALGREVPRCCCTAVVHACGGVAAPLRLYALGIAVVWRFGAETCAPGWHICFSRQRHGAHSRQQLGFRFLGITPHERASPGDPESYTAASCSSFSGSSRSTTASLNPAKLKLLKAATGLPVHTTSIGRRASASYCV